MTNPWYMTFALVASNAPIIFPVISLLCRKNPRIIDAALFFYVGFGSVLYHLCQSGGYCLGESIEVLRPADFIFVYALGFWVIMRILCLHQEIMFVLELTAFFCFIVLSSYLIGTILFPVAMTLFFIGMLLFKSYTLHIPMMSFGFFLFVWSVIMMCIGLFFFLFAFDIESPTYYIWHSLWHVLSMIAIWLFYEAGTGTIFFDIIGLHFIHLKLEDLRDRACYWNGHFFERDNLKRQLLV